VKVKSTQEKGGDASHCIVCSKKIPFFCRNNHLIQNSEGEDRPICDDCFSLNGDKDIQLKDIGDLRIKHHRIKMSKNKTIDFVEAYKSTISLSNMWLIAAIASLIGSLIWYSNYTFIPVIGFGVAIYYYRDSLGYKRALSETEQQKLSDDLKERKGLGGLLIILILIIYYRIFSGIYTLGFVFDYSYGIPLYALYILALVIGYIFSAVLYHLKKKIYKIFMIALLSQEILLSAVFIFKLDLLPYSQGVLEGTIVANIIIICYLIFSKRVRNTFIE
jgi:hypothetical protein